MKDRMHEQMTGEIKEGTRTDTIVVLASILLDLTLLSINSVLGAGAGSAKSPTSVLIIFILLLAFTVVLNFVAIRALLKGKERRAKLMDGLLQMYKEEGIEKYYDPALLKGYETRYNLFTIVVTSLGALAILIPLVLFFTVSL